jgi:serine/threonine protein kinase
MITALNWTLGPYRIAREIGRGHFGTVYDATDADGRQIALKLVPVQGADSDEKVSAERHGAALQQRFSRTSNRLVPEVLDHHRIDPYYVIAMELVTGEPLTTLIKAGPVSADRAATIAKAICQFLEKAHEFTTSIDDQSETLIVHGDLKPAHILLLADGSIRVLDFGIAKALAARKPATTNHWGSVDYASPERLESGRVNEQVDFWSLGVILFEMLSGVRPYLHYEHDPSRLETAIRRQEPRLRVPTDVDPRLTAIVDKLLAPQLERRYQSASEIVQDLNAFLEGTPVVAFAEATRANQATVPIPKVADVTSRRESIAVTEPLPTPPPPATVGGRRYKPWTAAVLSFLIPGLGQIYNRDFLRGLFWLIITPGFWIGSAALFGWPFHLVSAYTAYLRAQPRPAAAATRPSRFPGIAFLRRRAAIGDRAVASPGAGQAAPQL